MANDYTTSALVDRITLKAFTSTSSSLSDQQILDLANDSNRSYIVPIAKTLREEYFVIKSDDVVTTGNDGSVAVPDSVASTLRTVAWNNAGLLTPLPRVEPEMSFQYRAMGGSLPLGYELRGYTLYTMPYIPNIELHLTYMERPRQMVLTDEAAEVSSRTGAVLTLADVPVEWQATAPSTVEVVSSVSPFPSLGVFDVSSLVGSTLTLTADPGSDTIWVADEGMSPFAGIPIELYPLLEVDIVATLFQGLGDARLKGILQRKKELEELVKRTMAPRTTGSARPIVNPSAPGMRQLYGYWPRR